MPVGPFRNRYFAEENSRGMSSMDERPPPAAIEADSTLDISGEVCPMTFVRTRLALDRLAPGGRLLVLLRGEEPRRNVPAAAVSQGHQVLWQDTDASGLTRLLLCRR
jgi:TusA-related sulfurtransferase